MSKSQTKNIKTLLLFWTGIVSLFGLYSYVLVDPNFTLIDNPMWGIFRDSSVQIGYFNRPLSYCIFLLLIIFLSVTAWYLRKQGALPHKWILAALGVGLFISYPFLSHDFFNYIFDAKIFTYYHQNPYLMRALDFPHDPMVRFMHWTHRTYPYGPTFLPMTIILSYLGGGKFLITYSLMKLFFLGLFILTFIQLRKLDKVLALAFITSPLILVEGLVNMHNDFIAIALILISWSASTSLQRWVYLLLSGGIKYITLPYALNGMKTKYYDLLNDLIFISLCCLILYSSFLNGPHVWYLLNLIPFLIFFPPVLQIGIESVALLAYTPYILFGGWDSTMRVEGHNVIFYIAFTTIIAGYAFLRIKRKTSFFIK